MNKKLKISIVSFPLLVVAGCSSSSTLENHSYNKKSDKNEKQIIQIDKNLHYISIGRDEDGCMMYQAQSDSMATIQAIVYQNSPGKFSLSKDKSSCL
jgi:hypothetical protein